MEWGEEDDSFRACWAVEPQGFWCRRIFAYCFFQGIQSMEYRIPEYGKNVYFLYLTATVECWYYQ